MTSLIVNILNINRMSVFIEKTAQCHHAAVFRTLPFQTIKNTVITIGAWRPARFQRPIAANPMSAWQRLAEGQNNMQMMFSPVDISRREPEIVALKMVEF